MTATIANARYFFHATVLDFFLGDSGLNEFTRPVRESLCSTSNPLSNEICAGGNTPSSSRGIYVDSAIRTCCGGRTLDGDAHVCTSRNITRALDATQLSKAGRWLREARQKPVNLSIS